MFSQVIDCPQMCPNCHCPCGLLISPAILPQKQICKLKYFAFFFFFLLKQKRQVLLLHSALQKNVHRRAYQLWRAYKALWVFLIHIILSSEGYVGRFMLLEKRSILFSDLSRLITRPVVGQRTLVPLCHVACSSKSESLISSLRSVIVPQ